MNTLLMVLVGVTLGLIGLGFGLGWYVRGAYVKRYLRQQLRQRAMAIQAVDPERKTLTVAGVCHEIKPGSILTVIDAVERT